MSAEFRSLPAPPRSATRQRRSPGSPFAVIAGLLIAAAAVSPVRAQSDGPIEEIVVMAQKRAQNLQDVPITINAFSDAALRSQNIENTWQLMNATPALHVSGNVRAGQVFIRGIGSDSVGGGSDSSSAVHLDGVYLARPEALLGEFLDVERVEVLKGPQGTLYGRNAVGGAINVISKRPTDTFESEVSLLVGNYSKFRTRAMVSGPLRENVNGRLAVLKSTRDGYVDNSVPGLPYFEDEDATAARGSLEFRPSDAVTFLLAGDVSRYRDNGVVNVPISFDPPLGEPPYDATVLPSNPFKASIGELPSDKRDYWGVTGTLSWDLGAATLNSITAFRGTRNDTVFITPAQPFRYTDFRPYTDQDQFSQELQLIGETGRLDWQIGAYYFTEEAEYQAAIFLGYLDDLQLNFDSRHDVDAYAVFAHADFQITDALSLIAAVRYSNEERQRQTGGSIGPSNLKDDWDAVTPKLGLQYRHSDRLMLYATASKGFKSGSFDSFSTAPAVNPELVWAYEGGMKSELLNDRLRLNVSAFYYDYTDLQVQTFDPILIATTSNAAKAEVTGAEIELIAAPDDHWRIELAAAFLDAEYTDFVSLINPIETGPDAGIEDPGTGFRFIDLSGNRLRSAPELSLTSAVQYEIPLEAGAVTLRAEYQYRSDVFYSQFNSPALRQDSYGVFNARGEYRSNDGHWTAAVFGKNLGDERYFTSVVAFAEIGIFGANGNPRTYGVEVGYSF